MSNKVMQWTVKLRFSVVDFCVRRKNKKGVAMKNTYEFTVLERLDDDDKYKIKYFIQLLMQQTKYKKLKEEIRARREEISKGETLTHDEIWTHLDV